MLIRKPGGILMMKLLPYKRMEKIAFHGEFIVIAYRYALLCRSMKYFMT